jgi:8-oxo-dGTP pyrophosphatase MutT (NUDIX family)
MAKKVPTEAKAAPARPTAAPAGHGRRLQTVQQRSAGGVVVRGATLLLISTQEGKRWQLPKGHIEEGETPEQAAVREVKEETGIAGRVVARLPEVEYWYVEKGKLRVHKRVDYFLLDYESGDAADFDAHEVSGAGWFGWDEGIAKLSFDNERQVAEQARKLAGSLALAI